MGGIGKSADGDALGVAVSALGGFLCIMCSVASRMGRGTNYASTYKKRLMGQGVISERGGFTFDFDIPMMREYLQAVAATSDSGMAD